MTTLEPFPWLLDLNRRASCFHFEHIGTRCTDRMEFLQGLAHIQGEYHALIEMAPEIDLAHLRFFPPPTSADDLAFVALAMELFRDFKAFYARFGDLIDIVVMHRSER